MLNENEQVKGEIFRPTDRIKLYVLEVKDTPDGPRIWFLGLILSWLNVYLKLKLPKFRMVLLKLMSIAREAGSRTKMAVWSNNPNVDAVGACVGVNGARVNAIVYELREMRRLDIINWSDDPAQLIENALSPAKGYFRYSG